MIVSLDFLVCRRVCCGIVGIYFSRTAVSMALGYGVVVAGDFGTGRALAARNVGLYAYRPFVHPSFLSDNRQYFLSLSMTAVKRKTKSFGRQANMPV